MAQYRSGTVTLVQNSATVVGASVDWQTASAVKIGDLFKNEDVNTWYQVSEVNSATNLSISPAWAAANASAADYLIARDFTPNYDLPEIAPGDLDWEAVYTRAMRLIDNTLITGNFARTYTITSGSGRLGWAVGLCSTAGQVVIANASAGTDQVSAIGIVASDMSTTVSVRSGGAVGSLPSGYVIGTPNTRYYLQPWNTTATFNLATTPPTTTGYILQYMGLNMSATSLQIGIDDYIAL